MQITPETVTLLWLGAGAVALWMWLPALLSALGLTPWQVSMDDDAAALEPSGSDAEYEELFVQLRGLGFVPVGTRKKTCWFFLHHWCRKFPARVFAVPRGDCIAVTFKLRPWDPWRIYFATAFSDGALVVTANQMERLRTEDADYLRWGLATPDRALLLERHREECRNFAAGGGRSVAVAAAEEINRLELQHASRNHRKRHRWTGLKVMSNSLWFLGIGLLVARRFGEAAPCALPVSIIAWGLLWPAIHASLFRASADRLRAEDARRQRSPTPRQLDGGAL